MVDVLLQGASVPSPRGRSAISVIAISISARLLRSGASSSACFSRGAEGAHHAQRVHQRLVGRASMPLPVGLQIVRPRDSRAEPRITPARSTSSSPASAAKSLPKGVEIDPALAVGRRRRQLLADAEAGDARQRDQIAPVAGLGERVMRPAQPTSDRAGGLLAATAGSLGLDHADDAVAGERVAIIAR